MTDAKLPRFRFHTLAQLQDEPEGFQRVEGVMDDDALAVLYGPSGSGKTALAMHLGVAVSEGACFLGRPCRPGVVVYVALEGGRRIRRRIEAASRALDLDAPTQLYVCRDALYLHQGESVLAFMADLRAALGTTVALTVIDTLSRASAGSDENSNAHRELTVAGIRAIQAETGGAVLVVAHTGWNENRLRGGYALQAAADVVLKVAEGDTKVLEVEKQRDGETGEKLGFVLEELAGSIIASPASVTDHVRLAKNHGAALDILNQIALSDGVPTSEWEKACMDRGITHSAFYRARKTLLTRNLISALTRNRYAPSLPGLDLLGVGSIHGNGSAMEPHGSSSTSSTPL